MMTGRKRTESAVAQANSASLTIAVGPLVGPVLSRLIGMMAVRASCPVDRLENAILVADALAAHGPSQVPDGQLRVEITTAGRSLELSVGPLRPDGGSALLAQSTIPGVGNVLERMADAVSVDHTADGEGELLVVSIGLGAVEMPGEGVNET